MKIGFAVSSPEEARSMDEYKKNLEKIAELGYTGVEPLIGNPGATNWKSFSEMLEQCNLELSGLRTGLVYTKEGLSFSDPDKNIRQKATNRLVDIIKFANRFGRPNILIGLMQGKIKKTAKVVEVKDRIVNCLRNCASVAEKCGIILALEPVNRYELIYNNTVDEIIQMIHKINSKQIKILIDTFHMNIEEKSIVKSIIRAGDYIGHVHFADSNRQVPGNGHLDFQQIIETLEKVGYHGYITVECEHTSGLNATAEKAITYLKTLVSLRRDGFLHASQKGF